jgi:hypothetical protein
MTTSRTPRVGIERVKANLAGLYTTVAWCNSREYELDLAEANAEALRGAFARYIPAARKTSGGRRGSTTAQKPAKTFQGFDPAAVRAWAAGNGYIPSPRGRIRTEVLEAFRAAGQVTR